VPSRAREVILPIYSTLVRPPLRVLCPALESSAQQRHGGVGADPEQGHENLGGCGVSFSGDIQDPPGQGPLQPTVGDPASTGGLD